METIAKSRRRARAKAPKTISGTVQYHGLCITCNYAPDCVSARNADKPILFCELFDDHVAPTRGEGLKPVAQPTSAKEEPGEFKGLCINCQERDICKFPKPTSGVWHCEEYQ